jgi:GT2 family glycosyltransferase
MIAIISTVYNEGDNIRALLESLRAQSLQPDEIVIVDGGSTDRTVAILREYESCLPLRVIVAPGCNISAGRNIAIRAAGGADPDAIIAATDAGVVLDARWLERLTTPFMDDPSLEVVGGFFRANPHTIFEAALGATTLPLADEIDAESFLPSSRSVAFRKAAWLRVGGYPEWLDYCEDLIFDLRLKQSGSPFAFAPEAIAYFRPRSTLRAFFKQYYLYARGDGKAGLWGKRHAARYGTYFIGVPLILWLMRRAHPLFGLLLVIGGLVYLRQPLRRLRVVLDDARRSSRVRVSLRSNLIALALVPVIRAVGDLAKMIGYPVGVVWRVRNRPPDWRINPNDQNQ